MRQIDIITAKKRNNKPGLTLFEMLISVVIFSLVVLGLSSIDTFSRYHVISSDKRAKLQNDAAYILEHMAKETARAIGDVTSSPNNLPVVIDDSNRRVKVYIDYDGDGQRSAGDRWIAYRYRDSSAPQAEQYQFWYCSQCTDSTCDTCSTAWGTVINTLSNKIISFTPSYSSSNNYAEMQLTACSDPDGSPSACYTLDNPTLNMKNRIQMPAVSIH